MWKYEDILSDINSGLEKYHPQDIVSRLNEHIVGQDQAKRLVAIALRNRIRRKQVAQELREEISPKNILMIGPTGVGKTEIARRMAQIVNAPFVKVEATKYSERGYVGRDVEHMIRSLVNHSVNLVKSRMRAQAKEEAESETEHQLSLAVQEALALRDEAAGQEPVSDPALIRRIRGGEFDHLTVRIRVRRKPVTIFPMVDMFPGMEDMETNFQSLLGGDSLPHTEEEKNLPLREARDQLLQQKMEEQVDTDRAIELGLKWAQEMGILFIDEIDKISDKMGGQGPDVSREGVQRDLLPLIEGTTVNTKYGVVRTDHILFIAAGAFHVSRPSDMIPELQGRFPVRVELSSLTRQDLRRILTEPRNSLVRQYQALLATEGVALEFSEDAYDQIVEAAFMLNHSLEDIGARRLQTILEHILEDILFEAGQTRKKSYLVTRKLVTARLKDIRNDQDVSRYIL